MLFASAELPSPALLESAASAAAQAAAQACSSSGDHTWSPVEVELLAARGLSSAEEGRPLPPPPAGEKFSLVRRICAAASCRRISATRSGSVTLCHRVSTLPQCPLGRVKLCMEEAGVSSVERKAGSSPWTWAEKVKSSPPGLRRALPLAASQCEGGRGVTRSVRGDAAAGAAAPASSRRSAS